MAFMRVHTHKEIYQLRRGDRRQVGKVGKFTHRLIRRDLGGGGGKGPWCLIKRRVGQDGVAKKITHLKIIDKR